MGTTLAGSQIRNTYIGLLKTSDNSAVSTLKTISDGAGNDTALKISSSLVDVASLSIQSVTQAAGATKMLMWNDSTKDVNWRSYNPSGVNAISSTTVTTPYEGAEIQLDAGATCIFEAGANIQITGTANRVTIATSIGDAAEQISMDVTHTDVSAGAGDFYQQMNFEFRDYENSLVKSTVRPTGGLVISSEPNATGGRDFVLDGGSVTWIVDTPANGGSGGSLNASKDLTEVTTSDLTILVDVSIINQIYSTEATRTITLPPPYIGRRIEIFFTSTPTSGGSYPEPQDMDTPMRFEVAPSSDKDPTPRSCGFAGRAVLYAAHDPSQRAHQAFGPSSKVDYLKFQDTSESEIVNGVETPAANKSVRGCFNATRIIMYGVSDECYLVDVETMTNFGTNVGGCKILDN